MENMKIAEQKDITISIEHFFGFPELDFDFIDAATGDLYHDYMDFMIKYHR